MNVSKICSECKQDKNLELYSRDKNRPDGRMYFCKECAAKKKKQIYDRNPIRINEKNKLYRTRNPYQAKLTNIKRDYGLSREEYESLPKFCDICNSTEKLCVDHCHESGKVRGILCGKCNTGLGMFRDDTAFLAGAIAYLEKFKK